MHPSTPTTSPVPAPCSSRARRDSSPRRDQTFCSAFSRTEQVLYRTTSACSASWVNRYPSRRSDPTTSSLSSSFIWQPKVSRYTVRTGMAQV